jgi:LAO/AO transport system kinase
VRGRRHDVVIVETVGVGQSETAVAGMTDMFVLLQLPNAGDDLQAIKKGVMELADLVVINKADLDEAAATRARAQISSSLRLIGLHGNPDHLHHDRGLAPEVLQLSALKGSGWTTSGPRSRASAPADGQRPAGRAPPAAGPGLDVGAASTPACAQRFRPPGRATALPHSPATCRQGRVAASVAARRLLDLFH